MTQADSLLSTPPINASPLSGLALQERQRARALKRLAKLRQKASAETERLIAFLDASDSYVTTELEDDDDRELVGDEEPSLGSPDRLWDQTKWGRCDGFDVDAELDTADAEPSLGSLGGIDQTLWSTGDRTDREPSLSGGGWSRFTDDREEDQLPA
jgi:hypothetical protein